MCGNYVLCPMSRPYVAHYEMQNTPDCWATEVISQQVMVKNVLFISLFPNAYQVILKYEIMQNSNSEWSYIYKNNKVY